jgi:hypothetical protein
MEVYSEETVQLDQLSFQGGFVDLEHISTPISKDCNFEGKVERLPGLTNKVRITFNHNCKPWKYSYTGEKHKPQEHTFIITLKYKSIVQSFNSPLFKIISARRNDVSDIIFSTLYDGNILCNSILDVLD